MSSGDNVESQCGEPDPEILLSRPVIVRALLMSASLAQLVVALPVALRMRIRFPHMTNVYLFYKKMFVSSLGVSVYYVYPKKVYTYFVNYLIPTIRASLFSLGPDGAVKIQTWRSPLAQCKLIAWSAIVANKSDKLACFPRHTASALIQYKLKRHRSIHPWVDIKLVALMKIRSLNSGELQYKRFPSDRSRCRAAAEPRWPCRAPNKTGARLETLYFLVMNYSWRVLFACVNQEETSPPPRPATRSRVDYSNKRAGCEIAERNASVERQVEIAAGRWQQLVRRCSDLGPSTRRATLRSGFVALSGLNDLALARKSAFRRIFGSFRSSKEIFNPVLNSNPIL
ncbi:hypothetical protein EVAR_21644_1 [Eumeta japonica]|uniref:Uncharacterized protein n=1 Tax=Eumeta variegata TaxID=151549 RepID=A0A4C1VH55_EUMVA|nr:hypothetical protein EVAR_21644_1 [Eumeta japonica]